MTWICWRIPTRSIVGASPWRVLGLLLSSLARAFAGFLIASHLVVGLGACAPDERRGRRALQEPVDPPPKPSVEQVYAPSSRLPRSAGSSDASVLPAFLPDEEYAREGSVPAKRLVYRVRLRVPRSLGEAPAAVPPPTAELHIDLSADRLRARFVGIGWPVPAGSEVRLRTDQSGVYVFDGEGGRPLNVGDLATWFEGGDLRHEPTFRVQQPHLRAQHGLGVILCHFVAEWSDTPLKSVIRRCGEGGSSPSFRVGLWRAERTAEVDIELPRAALRADEADPPTIEARDSQAFLGPSALVAFRPERGLPEHMSARPAEVGFDGLRIRNRGRARAIITINGAPAGWANVGSTIEIVGLRPGIYSVGAMRPMGLQTSQQRNIKVPAILSIPY